MKRIPFLSHVKNRARNFYSELLCPRTCILCGNASEAGLPLCSHCIQTEFEPYIGSDDLEHLRQAEPRCKHCGKILISEHE